VTTLNVLQFPYRIHLLHALSSVARKGDFAECNSYFDIQQDWGKCWCSYYSWLEQECCALSRIISVDTLIQTVEHISLAPDCNVTICVVWIRLQDTKIQGIYVNTVQCSAVQSAASSLVAEGIRVPSIKKWPGAGYGFSFHCWVRLDSIEEPQLVTTTSFRRQLFK